MYTATKPQSGWEMPGCQGEEAQPTTIDDYIIIREDKE